MDFEDEKEKNYFKDLDKRLKKLERDFIDIKFEIEDIDNKDVEILEDSFKKIIDFKQFLEENSNNSNSDSQNIPFVTNTLKEFNDNSLIYINKEKLKYKEENEALRREIELLSQKVDDLNTQLEKTKDIEIVQKKSNNLTSNNIEVKEVKENNKNTNNVVHNTNNFDTIQNKNTNMLRIKKNYEKYSQNSLNLIYNEFINKQSIEHSNEMKNFDVLSKKNISDNSNFWERFESNEIQNKNNKILENNRINYNTFGLNINLHDSQNNNSNYNIKYDLNSYSARKSNNQINPNKLQNIFEDKIGSNMRKYSPYILNKKQP